MTVIKGKNTLKHGVKENRSPQEREGEVDYFPTLSLMRLINSGKAGG